MERGVVFTSRELLSIDNGRAYQVGRAVSEEELNYLILYWDKLVSPTNNFVHLSLHNEEELIKCGILVRPKFVKYGFMSANMMTDFHARTHVEALTMLRKDESEVDWRMHFFNDQVSIHNEISERKEVLRFEIADILPVPPKDIPLYEILEFKERRKDELLALHGYMDELYSGVLKSGDFNLERAKAISGLRRSLEDLDKLNNQGWRSPLKFNLSTSFEFNISQLISGGSAVYAAMHSTQPFEVFFAGAVITALGGFIKIKPQFQSVISNGDPKLAYLTNARSDGILR
ncbi:DUF6236 family protein [Kosakonia radicincitans]|uniref:DUF6236 family protein n=1 Tax=Kosakonia radicincitans TaxID=283686 RepID=UPI0022B50865|nr:DUF6236 family protein [Kosakonia radicincitans]